MEVSVILNPSDYVVAFGISEKCSVHAYLNWLALDFSHLYDVIKTNLMIFTIVMKLDTFLYVFANKSY
jgi:hypothetical protein